MTGWIAVDWGTTRLRAWRMEGATPVADAASDDGMGGLEPAGFEPALMRLVSPWLGDRPVDVVACGMVGARQGWVEAAYAPVPCPPLAMPFTSPPVTDPRLRVHIVPGLRQDAPADVMRGEETQIAGHRALNPGWDGVLCLPGSHTKWAEVSAGEVVSFRTFMSGEIFAAVRGHTVLRHTLGDGWDDGAFAEALSDAMSRPEALAQRMFSLRAEALLHGLDPGAATARLSGLLIGIELAAARPYWLGREVAVIGDATLAGRYRTALTAQGVEATVAPADRTTLAGLAAARAMLESP
jgi:2-dehydro-3-deoxygalactonokinase